MKITVSGTERVTVFVPENKASEKCDNAGLLERGNICVPLKLMNCLVGPGIVIDLEHLYGEVQKLAEKGVEVTPEHLKISDRATICMPYHKLMDCLEEDRLLDKKFGSTRRGISPVYADKYMKKALRMGDLLHLEALKERLGGLVEWKNLTVEHGYGHAPVLADEMFQWLKEYGEFFIPFICDTTEYLGDAIKRNPFCLGLLYLGHSGI